MSAGNRRNIPKLDKIKAFQIFINEQTLFLPFSLLYATVQAKTAEIKHNIPRRQLININLKDKKKLLTKYTFR